MSTSQAPTTPVIRTQALPVDTKEIRINPPKPFDGNRNNLASFIQDIYVYLTLNRHIYDSQEKKIIFALSYLTEGTAKAWKEAFLGEILSQRPANFGTYEEFITRLQTAFSASDVEGEARAQLRQLKQGKSTADEYISEFWILAGRSKITDDKALIEYFMEGIHTSILAKIFALDKIPTTISEWYEKASRFDAQYRRFQEISGRKKGTNITPTRFTTASPKYVSSKDPNAMDIDRLTTEEIERHKKERRCFNCHRIGHQAKECRSGKTPDNSQDNQSYKYQGVKKTATTARAMIRNLVEDMDPEEKEKLMDDITKEQDF